MVIDQIDAADSVVDGLLSIDLAGLDQAGLLSLTERVEVRRRLAAVELGQPSTAALLRGLLRITPAEAKRRVRVAADLGPRSNSLTFSTPTACCRPTPTTSRPHRLRLTAALSDRVVLPGRRSRYRTVVRDTIASDSFHWICRA